MSEESILEYWPEGIAAARIPANNNVRLLQALILNPAISATTAAQPGSPVEGDVYILPSSPTGSQWAAFFENDVVIYYNSTWTAYIPNFGLRKFVEDQGEDWQFIGDSSGGWSAAGGGGGGSRTPAVQSVTSSATVTPTFADDIVLITAQATGLTLANPTGTAIPNLGMVIRIKDNGTARTISYDTQYRAIGVTLPVTTVISKTLYLAMIFNSTDTRWDVLAVGIEA